MIHLFHKFHTKHSEFRTKYKWRGSQLHWSWRNPKGSIKRLWQNIFWGWNDSDTWNLDYEIAKFILPRLRRLKEISHGVTSLVATENSSIEEDTKIWNEILDKMITAFDLIINGEDISSYNFAGELVPVEGKENKEHKAYTIKYTDIERAEVDRFRKDQEENEKKIQEGLELFAKYYRGLWD